MPDVGGVTRCGGDADSEVGVGGADQIYAGSGGQQDFAIRGGDDAGVFYIRRNQVDLSASLGGEVACVAEVGGAEDGGVVVAPGKKVGVAKVEGGGDQARDVNRCARTEHDAVGVDQEYAPVGLQGAEDLAGVVADDAVEYGGGRSLLGEPGGFVRAYREALPVDDGAGGVGDGEGVAAGGEAGLAVHD